ncbi:pyocin knob domain-containing protein [Mesonia aestuariivivens]|uniref:Pyocin knob domain-containing protein n=1 Tax=Mesonia aestuariivivens TaxID=2796128 RepID=A0ABS6W378_9FLAO|nr:pyocin knob domain-containing protein [Mesonia aestuariivivens]MBW2962316.1 pyocin knob domain-containing protein [Mesonia aestuariivivens]
MNFSEKIIQNISSFKAFIVAKLNLLKSYIDANEVKIADLEGMVLYADMANQKILIRNASGVLISEVGVGWLNNEGTTFTYNESTEKLELRNDADELLSEIPVSSFVSNLAKSISLSGSNLHLRDTENNILSSVTFQITNIQGLQAALDLKANDSEVIHKTGNADQLITGNDTEVENYTSYGLGVFNLPVRPLVDGVVTYGESGIYAAGENTSFLNSPRYISLSRNNQTFALMFSISTKRAGLQFFDGTQEEIWHSGKFTQTEIDQWNEAYSWGDFRDFGLGANAPAISDLDSVAEISSLKSGFYSAQGTTLGRPLGGGGTVMIIKHSTGFFSITYRYISDGGTVRTLERKLSNGVFSNWKKVWNEEDFTQTNINEWNEAFLKTPVAVSFTGDSNPTLTITRQDGTPLTASLLANQQLEFTDDVINSGSFNDNNDGVIMIITADGKIIDFSIDGRYLLLSDPRIAQWNTVTQKANADDSRFHNHGNKTVLDQITQEKYNSWEEQKTIDPANISESKPYSGKLINVGVIFNSNYTENSIVYLTADNNWKLASVADNSATKKLAMYVGGVLLTEGIVQIGSNSYGTGSSIYLSTNGEITDQPVTAANQYNRVVGYYLGDNIVEFSPDNTWIQNN